MQGQQGDEQEPPPRALTFAEACDKYSQIAATADPLWFARAFARRAAVNAGQMAKFVERALGSGSGGGGGE